MGMLTAKKKKQTREQFHASTPTLPASSRTFRWSPAACCRTNLLTRKSQQYRYVYVSLALNFSLDYQLPRRSLKGEFLRKEHKLCYIYIVVNFCWLKHTHSLGAMSILHKFAHEFHFVSQKKSRDAQNNVSKTVEEYYVQIRDIIEKKNTFYFIIY